jgi:ATP-dependent RNA helicase DeaD
VNFDVPYDTESYVHRIGRTGRAGRSGEAILFVAPRERNMLRLIEKATRQPIEPMHLPTVEDVNARRAERFKARIAAVLASGVARPYRELIEEFARESGADLGDVAAALATLAQGRTPLLLDTHPAPTDAPVDAVTPAGRGPAKGQLRGGNATERTYRLDVGRAQGVQVGNIVGAIANEAGLDGSQINGIDIRREHTLVRLPADLAPAVISRLQAVKVKGRALAIRPAEAESAAAPRGERPPSRREGAPHRGQGKFARRNKKARR